MERHILNENADSLEILKYKYPKSIISPDVLEELYVNDPTEDKEYFDWMVKQNIKTSHKNEVNNKIISLAKDFHLFQDKLKINDINFYHSLEILQNDIDDVKNQLTKKERKRFKIQEGPTIYEDAKFRILKPETMSEVCNAGFDTLWCGSSSLIPEDVNDYSVYVIINKLLQRPDINDYDDPEKFDYAQEKFLRLKKLLVMIDKSFKGSYLEADLQDYLLIDAHNEEFDGALSELTNLHIEKTVFADHQNSDRKQKIRGELPDIGVVQEWCETREVVGEQKDIILERYRLLSEQYNNPELEVGDRVELVSMNDAYKRPPKGTLGTCIDIEQTPWGPEYKVKWETGIELSLLPKEDVYLKVNKENLQEEKITKEEAILRFLDKNLIVTKKNNAYYFAYKLWNDYYVAAAYDTGISAYRIKFINEVDKYFSVGINEFEKILKHWLFKNFNFKSAYPFNCYLNEPDPWKIKNEPLNEQKENLQEATDIKTAIFRFLDNNLTKVRALRPGRYLFKYKHDPKNYVVRYYPHYNELHYLFEFYETVDKYFSISPEVFKSILVEWIEMRLNTKVDLKRIRDYASPNKFWEIGNEHLDESIL